MISSVNESPPFRTLYQVLLEALPKLAGPRVLDVGSGSGEKSRLLASMGATVMGVDPNETAVAIARERAGGPEYQVSSAHSLPFPDHSFDAAIFTDSLHHIEEMQRALAEVSRVLRPGGAVLVLEPEAGSSGHQVFRLIDDESSVYRQAQDCLAATVKSGALTLVSTVHFASKYHVADTSALIADMSAVDASRSCDGTAREVLDSQFANLTERDDQGLFLICWQRLDRYKKQPD